ncbi:predicted protein [Lichtheimia corymbifera JMRC:FSU:9682]|uniref:Uncharacterized protein n=1 Tax=Lichtheimia corymbifera JMRC:FSU:9682 TaxID=1263082 RepID=A0A068RKG8_9FUNG|nr:predicted protein [Lichtheimia corymbifera JMRC:FSU:9682]
MAKSWRVHSLLQHPRSLTLHVLLHTLLPRPILTAFIPAAAISKVFTPLGQNGVHNFVIYCNTRSLAHSSATTKRNSNCCYHQHVIDIITSILELGNETYVNAPSEFPDNTRCDTLRIPRSITRNSQWNVTEDSMNRGDYEGVFVPLSRTAFFAAASCLAAFF